MNSSNNFLAWIRGPAVDFDDWAKTVQDDWWKWSNVLEYLKKVCPLTC